MRGTTEGCGVIPTTEAETSYAASRTSQHPPPTAVARVCQTELASSSGEGSPVGGGVGWWKKCGRGYRANAAGKVVKVETVTMKVGQMLKGSTGSRQNVQPLTEHPVMFIHQCFVCIHGPENVYCNATRRQAKAAVPEVCQYVVRKGKRWCTTRDSRADAQKRLIYA